MISVFFIYALNVTSRYVPFPNANDLSAKMKVAKTNLRIS